MRTVVAMLQLLSLALMTTRSWACPDICYCYEDFVTCSEFTDLDLTLIPVTVKTLVLSQGEMEEVPPAFFARAVNLKTLELNGFNARVVRGGAFRGLNNLDKFVIKGSSFDIVEPDAFSGISGIYTFSISDSHFGRVGKHAFAEISNVSDWKIWSCYFASLSDEVFSGISKVHSLQIYQNNITYIGHDIFATAREIEYVNFYMNTINVMSNGSLMHIEKTAELLVVYANKFQCVCENAWMTTEPSFEYYAESNQCFFSNDLSLSENLFRIVDVSEDVLCPVTRPERRLPPTSTLGTLPSVVEEVEIWSDHEGLNPDPEPETVQERVYTGNVSVNASSHGQSGMNLTSVSDAPPYKDSTSQDWSGIADSTLSSLSVDPTIFSIDYSVDAETGSMNAESSSSTSSSSPTGDVEFGTTTMLHPSSASSSESDNLTSMPDASHSTDIYEASSIIVVEPVSFSSSLLDGDESSVVPVDIYDTRESTTEFVISPISFDASSIPVVDDTSISTAPESMVSSKLSHGLSTLHVVDTVSTISSDTSENVSTISSDTSESVSTISSDTSEIVSTISSNISENVSTISSDTSESVSTLSSDNSESDTRVPSDISETVSTLPSDASSIPSSDTSIPSSFHSSSSVIETTAKADVTHSDRLSSMLSTTEEEMGETSFIMPVDGDSSKDVVSFETMRPSSAIPSTSSTKVYSHPSTTPASPSTAETTELPDTSSSSSLGSEDANGDISPENEDQEAIEGEKPKKTVSIIDVITSKSTNTHDPNPTFPIEVPFDLPERAKIASVRDKALYEQAQRDKQIYALPYSTSAVGMKTERSGDSGASSVGKGHFTVILVIMSSLLMRHLL